MLLVVIVQLLIYFVIANANEEVKRAATLDLHGHYRVEWYVDQNNKAVTFELKVQTSGYVGFGISNHARMKGADIVIGVVHSDGDTDFSDRHATGNSLPLIDEKQDWTLLDSSQTDGITYLKFSRKIDTCDPQDVPITGGAQRFIWAFGNQEAIIYHGENRGSYVINILDPPSPDIDLSMYDTFSLTTEVTMPTKDTTYWCTVFRSPTFSQKQHAIAMGPHVESELAKKHTHHLAVFQCKASTGENAADYLEQYVQAGGRDCAKDGKVRGSPIFQHCAADTPIYSWAMGAREMHFPEDVGFSISEKETEYYFLEIHLDNPLGQKNIQFETGMKFYYTSELRKYEAGSFVLMFSATDWRLVIPPASTDFLMAAHCGPYCTNQFNPEGLNIFNVQLHSHNSGKRLRLRQFRDGIELPWVADDQTFDNHYQENRNVPLRKVLPGDQLTLECGYDNTWVNPPGTVIGGFSTREEMCASTIYYYPKSKLFSCGSMPFDDGLLQMFGINNVTSVVGSSNPMITEPEHLKGKRYLDYLDNEFKWTSKSIKRLERAMTVGPHFAMCELGSKPKQVSETEEDDQSIFISYPANFKPYEKVEECSRESNFKVAQFLKSSSRNKQKSNGFRKFKNFSSFLQFSM